jgi:hypothetical protein
VSKLRRPSTPPAPSGLELKDSIMRSSALFFILLLTQYHEVFTLRRSSQYHLISSLGDRQGANITCSSSLEQYLSLTWYSFCLLFILGRLPYMDKMYRNISATKHIGTKLIGYKMYRMKIISATKCIGGQNVSPASNF